MLYHGKWIALKYILDNSIVIAKLLYWSFRLIKIVIEQRKLAWPPHGYDKAHDFEVIGDVGGWVGVTNKARDAHD